MDPSAYSFKNLMATICFENDTLSIPKDWNKEAEEGFRTEETRLSSLTFVLKTDIRPTDVLLGRGKSHQKHYGNVRYQGERICDNSTFHDKSDIVHQNFLENLAKNYCSHLLVGLVTQYRERYFAQVADHEKHLIAGEIVSKVRSHGGRFLKYEGTWGAFIQIDDEVSRIKVMRALQYRQRCKKRVMKNLEPEAAIKETCKKNKKEENFLPESQEAQKGKNITGDASVPADQRLPKQSSECILVPCTAAVAEDHASFPNKMAENSIAPHIQDHSISAQNIALLQSKKGQSLTPQSDFQYQLLQMQQKRDLLKARQEIEKLRHCVKAMKRENQRLQMLLKLGQEDKHQYISFNQTDQEQNGFFVMAVSNLHSRIQSDDSYDDLDSISESSSSLFVDSIEGDLNFIMFQMSLMIRPTSCFCKGNPN
jgi:hypothetical protein